jgi:protein-S-isoprenylcysteine O-methyltransferase Ste14
MWFFLIPLLLSFACNIASVFTAAYARRLGPRRGRLASAILRNALGMPLLGLGYILAAVQAVPRLLPSSDWLDLAGWLLIILGASLIVWALAALRWRAAVPSVADEIVRDGPYAHVRHPLYDGVFLELAGAVLVRPTWPVVLSSVLALGWLLVQARAEEQDLRQRLSSYAEYMAQVPRFLPRLRRA